MIELLTKIESLLDAEVRPQLLLHGGGMETVRLEDGRYVYRLTGQCAGCPSAYLTAEELIRRTLLANIPELQDAVLEQGVSDELMDMAKKFLRHE